MKISCSSMLAWHAISMPIFLARPSKTMGLAWLCPAQSWRPRLLLLMGEHHVFCCFVAQTRRCWYQLAWLGCAKTPPARTSSQGLHGTDAAVQVPASLLWLCRESCCLHQLSGFLWYVVQTQQCRYQVVLLGCAKTFAAHTSSWVFCGADAQHGETSKCDHLHAGRGVLLVWQRARG